MAWIRTIIVLSLLVSSVYMNRIHGDKCRKDLNENEYLHNRRDLPGFENIFVFLTYFWCIRNRLKYISCKDIHSYSCRYYNHGFNWYNLIFYWYQPLISIFIQPVADNIIITITNAVILTIFTGIIITFAVKEIVGLSWSPRSFYYQCCRC